MVGADPEKFLEDFWGLLCPPSSPGFLWDRKKNFFFFVCDGVAFRFRFRNDGLFHFFSRKLEKKKKLLLGRIPPIKWAWTAALVCYNLAVFVVAVVAVVVAAVAVAVAAADYC